MHAAVSILLGKLVHPVTDALAEAAKKLTAKLLRKRGERLTAEGKMPPRRSE